MQVRGIRVVVLRPAPEPAGCRGAAAARAGTGAGPGETARRAVSARLFRLDLLCLERFKQHPRLTPPMSPPAKILFFFFENFPDQ